MQDKVEHTGKATSSSQPHTSYAKHVAPVLHISPQGDRYRWQIGDLHGIANDAIDRHRQGFT